METYIIHGYIFHTEADAKAYCRTQIDKSIPVVVVNQSVTEEKADVIWDI